MEPTLQACVQADGEVSGVLLDGHCPRLPEHRCADLGTLWTAAVARRISTLVSSIQFI